MEPDVIVSQSARYCRFHPDATIADAADSIWKAVTDPTWRTPPETAPVQKSDTKFLWPAAGRLIDGFCHHHDDAGTGTEGINLAVEPGTEIHAAEYGEIAYAGNELRGFHNLIIIRHADGWVSAYAQTDEMLVKRGDVVTRGEVIAKIRDPDSIFPFHFELRRRQESVNPLLYLENKDHGIAQLNGARCRG
jgi:murein DD-endopeptidase MepM/ murein hydrolase activator NlpD